MTLAEYIIWEFEGGKLGGQYTDRKADLGGPTRWGVTQRLASAYYGRQVTKDEIKNLSLANAVKILDTVFVRETNYHSLADWRVRLVVTDFAINAGADDATPALQRAVGAKPDGVCGPITLALSNAADPWSTIAKVMSTRQFKHVQQSYKPLQIENLRGWMNRCSMLLARVTWAEPLE
jgi:lysozyme family protein